MEIVLASKNPGKLQEFKALVQSNANGALTFPLEFLLAPQDFDVEETGKSFCENALLKARHCAQLTGKYAMADDSGLCVKALNFEPGIHSARYCEGSDGDRRVKLLAAMQEIPSDKRQAYFACALVLVNESGETVFQTEIHWQGQIISEEMGENGFGFDPIFQPDGYEITSAQLTPEEKNRLSHRGMAFSALLQFLADSASPKLDKAKP
jgi:XTP/dITP diphosphohydrolase